ncbi:hypothetical protein HGR_15129 [Hylemonella gracilis ATCC 19624]|uniref:Transposase n=1 Tax=Hylemonella gracilis ATCC 19624 TaxID=887062 RepID=F3KX37_9BURK|nr:transposase [Hylemonella gracilis]EGI75666.1 hypothetical protein HGR_15129 [Hylemonella gracilis ATCC 19624]
MKKRFTEEQIIGFLREAESGLAVAELCLHHDDVRFAGAAGSLGLVDRQESVL